MKIGHRWTYFHTSRKQPAVTREARALAELPELSGPGDRRLFELARRTKPQDASYRLGFEPHLSIDDLVACGVWWGDFGPRNHKRFQSAVDYALARLSQETGYNRRVGKRKALLEDDYRRIENLISRALAEWRPIAEALGKHVNQGIDLIELDAHEGKGTYLDEWREGDDPYEGLTVAQWRALELALERNDAGFFVSDTALIEAGYPECSARREEGEHWGDVTERLSDGQRKLVRSLIRRDILYYPHNDLVGVRDPETLRSELDYWLRSRAAELAKASLRAPRSRQSGLALA